MSLNASLPVVFLAFANDLDSHLDALKQESRDIYQNLRPLEEQGKLIIHREESIEVDELYTDLLALKDRIVIFHYAGHADGSMLQFEQGEGKASGIAGLLGQQSSLQLVFLNGCATQDQVALLHQAGVPAVIATSVKINDRTATQLSNAFYAALAAGESIFSAFDAAKFYIESKLEGQSGPQLTLSRQPNFNFSNAPNQSPPSFEFAWSLYTRDDCVNDLQQWRLASAKDKWQVTLVSSNKTLKDQDGEPIVVNLQQRMRTVPGLRCQQCNLLLGFANDDRRQQHPQPCPACGAKKFQQERVDTSVGQGYLEFDFNLQQARLIAGKVLAVSAPADLLLTALYLPYWRFEFATCSEFSAQRGILDDPYAEQPVLKWEKVEDQYVTDTQSFLVPAFAWLSANQLVNLVSTATDWRWQFNDVKQMNRLDFAQPFLPSTWPVTTAFEQLFQLVEKQIRAEIEQSIGGLQRKDIKQDTHLIGLKVASIWLPHYSAMRLNGTGQDAILINAQSGGVKSPSTPIQSVLHSEMTMATNQTPSRISAPSNKTSNLVSIYSGIGIGIMVGLLMGLAAPQAAGAKSIVAIFIGAVGVGLAALLGLNDRHFSTAKGLRIGSFGIAVAVSALLGIYVRDNNLLSPSVEDRVQSLRSSFKNLDDQQLIALMTPNGQKEGEKVNEVNALTAANVFDPRSALFSASGVDRSICANLSSIDQEVVSVDEALRSFRNWDDDGLYGWKQFANSVQQELPKNNQKAMLFIGRDAACGLNQDISPIKPDSAVCNQLQAQELKLEELANIFNSTQASQRVYQQIQIEISNDAEHTALQLLVPVLCSTKINSEDEE